MTALTKSLCWVAVLMTLAVAAIFDIVPEQFARTMIPLLAVLSAVSINARPCRWLGKGKAA